MKDSRGKWSRKSLLGAVAALSLIATACGSSTQTSSSGGAAPPSGQTSNQPPGPSTASSQPSSAASAAGSPAACTKPYKLNIVYVEPSGSILPLWVTKEGGYFKKHCLDVTLNLVRGGAKTAQAIVSGADQFGTVSDTEVINASAHGGGLVVAAVMDVKPFIWVYAGKNVTSIKQLKGKPIAISQKGSLTDYTMREAVKAAGLTYKDFRVQSMGSQPSQLAALEAGAVKAAALVPPFTLKAQSQGLHSIFSPSQIPKSDQIEAQNLVTTTKFLSQHRDVAVRVVQAYIDGIKRMESDKALDIKTLEKYTKASPKIAAGVYATFSGSSIYTGIPPLKSVSSLKVQLRLLQAHNPTLKVSNINALLDNSLVQAAMKANASGQ